MPKIIYINPKANSTLQISYIEFKTPPAILNLKFNQGVTVWSAISFAGDRSNLFNLAKLITGATKRHGEFQGKKQGYTQLGSLKLILNVGNVLRKFGWNAKTGLSREAELPVGMTCASYKFKWGASDLVCELSSDVFLEDAIITLLFIVAWNAKMSTYGPHSLVKRLQNEWAAVFIVFNEGILDRKRRFLTSQGKIYSPSGQLSMTWRFKCELQKDIRTCQLLSCNTLAGWRTSKRN